MSTRVIIHCGVNNCRNTLATYTLEDVGDFSGTLEVPICPDHRNVTWQGAYPLAQAIVRGLDSYLPQFAAVVPAEDLRPAFERAATDKKRTAHEVIQ